MDIRRTLLRVLLRLFMIPRALDNEMEQQCHVPAGIQSGGPVITSSPHTELLSCSNTNWSANIQFEEFLLETHVCIALHRNLPVVISYISEFILLM